ncbi:hypothetical protein ON010_g17096 [Phytophthora cinnamomi]|nr:hypothetical protein ON010_g17096 [Phytophthora cinnamomi]
MVPSSAAPVSSAARRDAPSACSRAGARMLPAGEKAGVAAAAWGSFNAGDKIASGRAMEGGGLRSAGRGGDRVAGPARHPRRRIHRGAGGGRCLFTGVVDNRGFDSKQHGI